MPEPKRPKRSARPAPSPPPSPPRPGLVLTCEHGGNQVPARYRRLFAHGAFSLRSHRGWDPGALPLAQSLARALHAPLIASTTTRLLIDLNRSLDNPSAFSKYTADLPMDDRLAIIAKHYYPHRKQVIQTVDDRVDAGKCPVVHVGVHSFTPVLRGLRRDVHVGLLFDPSRPLEAALCRTWREALVKLRPRWIVAMNRPYKGTDDGLTTSLRRLFDPHEYLGIELEVVQPLVTRTGPARRRVHADLGRALGEAIDRLAESLPARTRGSRGR